MNEVHRQTAADWHGGDRSSALYAYATSGVVREVILDEIDDRLAIVEEAEVGSDFDRVGEHQRLLALLRHMDRKLIAARAFGIGREHGRAAARRWQHEAFDDQAPSVAAALAGRVLDTYNDGVPEMLDLVSGWDRVASSAEIADQAGWPEPATDDVAAHQRWAAAQPDIDQEYMAGFADGFWDVALAACRRELADASVYLGPSGRAVGAALDRLDHRAAEPGGSGPRPTQQPLHRGIEL